MIAIRTRILAPTIALVIIGSLTLALLALRDSHREIEEVYDAQLVQAARVLQGLLQREDPQQADWGQIGATLETALDLSSEGILSHPYEINLSFQIWSSDGQLLARSKDAPSLPAPPSAGIHDMLINGQDWCGVLLEDDVRGLRIWVGERDDLRQDLIQRIVQHTLLPTLIGLPLLALIIWLLLGWGLKPLQRLAWQIRSRPVDSLEPLASGPQPPELEPMRAALDHQLSQLRALLERERRFIADAAHELRTPLAILDIHARNARQATSDQEREEALAFLQQGVIRATRIASQLLTMARLEPATHEQHPLNLTALVREELAELTPLALRRQVDLVLDNETDCTLMGDPGSIAIMLQNLVSNALTFAPQGTEVRVRLRQSGDGQVVVQVLDDGPGVSEAVLGRLCDRFYSDGNPEGAGLGLAIVEMISRRLGAALHFSNRGQGGFCVQLSFPQLTRGH
ncbi:MULTISPECIES: sensor histidine kinase [unclassified Pseudomonas]|uniref:sensor histidine kinase n=1 Tax=unclassified Pseudomonas TaxID=196821 RepID=UPI002447AD6C|nr:MULTISPECIES: sensor histidine kinase [unclassified Pseudomonas]MDG9928018.1 ATP-binding protein [Pseudomonas sp. GD04042]MDH0482027.1 ATP-binding protein [Pseudomonas sp. GD04015]MDH0604078.1 ATP-binding protein [Pseudomonas sp. GD03869]